MSFRSYALVFFSVTIFSGCGGNRHAVRTEQPAAAPLVAGIGDVLLHVEKKACLKNAFGKCDIFKRKTNTGFVDVRFLGVEPGGEVVLSRKDVSIVSNETTMSRTPVSFATGQSSTKVEGNAYSYGSTTTYQATAKTQSQTATIHPQEDYHVVIPSDEIAIRIPEMGVPIPIEGQILEILAATPYSIKYIVRRR